MYSSSGIWNQIYLNKLSIHTDGIVQRKQAEREKAVDWNQKNKDSSINYFNKHLPLLSVFI